MSDPQPVKERLNIAYEGETCSKCGYSGTHDRNSGAMDRFAPQEGEKTWYDIIACGGCGHTLKERGGKFDERTGELRDIEEVKWTVVNAER